MSVCLVKSTHICLFKNAGTVTYVCFLLKRDNMTVYVFSSQNFQLFCIFFFCLSKSLSSFVSGFFQNTCLEEAMSVFSAQNALGTDVCFSVSFKISAYLFPTLFKKRVYRVYVCLFSLFKKWTRSGMFSQKNAQVVYVFLALLSGSLDIQALLKLPTAKVFIFYFTQIPRGRTHVSLPHFSGSIYLCLYLKHLL